MIKVLFICHGNICRSTMAQSVFAHMVSQEGISDSFVIDSAATSREEIGNPPHYGTAAKLREVNIPLIPHRARQVTQSDYREFDYLICMDRNNIRNLRAMVNNDPQGKICKFLSFASLDRDIADPWYTGNFDETYDDICIGCRAFLDHLRKNKLI